MKEPERKFPDRPRRSASADAALRAEMRRIAKMTIEERVRAALGLVKDFPVSRAEEKER